MCGGWDGCRTDENLRNSTDGSREEILCRLESASLRVFDDFLLYTHLELRDVALRYLALWWWLWWCSIFAC